MRVRDLEEILESLLSWRLVEASDLVEGLSLLSIDRRNRSLRVERQSGMGFLVKQPEPHSRATVAREGAFYALCRERPWGGELAGLLPVLESWRPDETVLVCELLDEARPLLSAWRENPEEAARLAAALGAALGTVHRVFRPTPPGLEEALPELPAGPPWAFRLAVPGPEAFRHLHPAQLEVLRVIQGEAELPARLEEWRGRWRDDTLLHGDVRSDNVLVLPGPSLRLVDWELVQRGDPAWDLAAALREHLLHWLLGMPLAPQLAAEERLAAAEVPLAAVQAGVRALWQAYLEAARVPAAEHAALKERAVAFSAAQLLVCAWEESARGPRLTSLAVLLLQLAANVLADPAQAARQLYGFAEPEEEAAAA